MTGPQPHDDKPAKAAPPGAAQEGSDPAGAEASDKGASGVADYMKRPKEAGSYAQLGLAGGEGDKMGAAEGLPPDKAQDLNQIAADDVGATAMAERAGERADKAEGKA